MKLPTPHCREVIKALEKAGFKVVGGTGSSHLRLKREKRAANDSVRIAIVPMHTEIAQGTLRSIIEQAGLTREEFLALL